MTTAAGSDPGQRGTGQHASGAPGGRARSAAMLLCGALAMALVGCAGDPPPEAEGDYPDIADSPAERPEVASAREREEITEGLRADRQADRYVTESRYGADTAGAPDQVATSPGGAPPRAPAASGERRRSTEVRPPDYNPPPASAAPATSAPADRMDAGETPTPAPGDIARRNLPPPPGAARSATAVPDGSGSFPATGPSRPGQGFPTGPTMAAPAPAPYTGPVVVDSRGVTTLGPGGPVTSPGPYGSPYGPAGASTGYASGMMPGTATAAAGVAPGTLPLSTYGPMMGARSQRVAVIYFADGSSGLSGRDRAVLAQVANLQRQYRGVLRVVGHASSRTNATSIARHNLANFNVSLARANTVASALMNNGVPGRFLYVGAVSDAQPVYYEVMPTGEAGNRRAEIYLDY